MDLDDICNIDEFGNEFEITTQSYSPSFKIDGVKVYPLRRFKDDGGSFLELARLNGGELLLGGSRIDVYDGGSPVPFIPQQINVSHVMPGAIKAWHLHFKQEDVWFVPPQDRLVVGLLDLRKNSPTKFCTMRLVLGDGDGQALLIPRGVAHGCSNPYDRPMQLMYIVNQQFNADAPDEHRLDYAAYVGRSFWEIQPG